MAFLKTLWSWTKRRKNNHGYCQCSIWGSSQGISRQEKYSDCERTLWAGWCIPSRILPLDPSRKCKDLTRGKGPIGFREDSGSIPIFGVCQGGSWNPYAPATHGDTDERQEDSALDVKVQTCVPHSKAESLPQAAKIYSDRKRCWESGQQRIWRPRTKSGTFVRYYIYPAEWRVLLSFHNSRRLYETGSCICFEWISGSGFCFGDGKLTSKEPRCLVEQRYDDSQRPRHPLHQCEVYPISKKQRATAIHVASRELLGQRPSGKLLRAYERRTRQRDSGMDFIWGCKDLYRPLDGLLQQWPLPVGSGKIFSKWILQRYNQGEYPADILPPYGLNKNVFDFGSILAKKRDSEN